MKRILISSRNDQFPNLSQTRGPASPVSGHGNSAPAVSPAMLSAGAVSYDATAERWISRPSDSKSVAGGAAELRQPRLHRHTSDNRPVSSPEGAGHFLPVVMDAVTVLMAVIVFGALAWFCLVLA